MRWSFGTYEPSSMYGPVPIPRVAAFSVVYMSFGTIDEYRCQAR